MQHSEKNQIKNPTKSLSFGEVGGVDVGGATIIVTGASGSIGAETVKSLLREDFSVIMACRNLQKGVSVRAKILKEFSGKENSVLLEELDLASFTSIYKFVENISRRHIRLTGLMNNAGTLNRTFTLTPEGFENTIGVNYVGVFLLTKLLIPMLEDGSGITNVVSMTTNPKRIDKQIFDFTPEKFRQLRSYSQSKTALMLFTASLAERSHGKFHVNAGDPGSVESEILRLSRWFDFLADLLFRPLIKTPRKGAIPLVNAQLSKDTGKLFSGNRHIYIREKYAQHPLRKWLWEETEKKIAEIQIQSGKH